MNPDDLRARFAALQVWETKGQRAPNKPLFALWAKRSFRPWNGSHQRSSPFFLQLARQIPDNKF